MTLKVKHERLRAVIRRLKTVRVLVIGDLILDEYISGGVDRISPEAPVPVVQALKRAYVPGGAANVANNIYALGGGVGVVGVVGRDDYRTRLVAYLKREKVDVRGVITDSKRCTTLKTRIIAGHQQVVRVDWENVEPISERVLGRVRRFLERNLARYDAIIIEDYGKGLITPSLLNSVMRLRQSQIVMVDPKENHFDFYRNVTAITPNRKEVENAIRYLKIKSQSHDLALYDDNLASDEDIVKAGRELRRYLRLEALLITLGEQGMRLFDSEGVRHIPVFAREVYDVSGAGDTVISVFTMARAAGASFYEAAVLANAAASVVVGKIGTATLSQQELLAETAKLFTRR